jgi:clan AA aspartic protease
MGVTHVTAKLTNLAKTREGYEALFLVDTGAVHCVAPAQELGRAGIEIEGRQSYELANGQAVEYTYGFARVSFLGAETVVQVVFGPADCEPILGVVALENVGIGVDPMTQTLKRFPAVPLKEIGAAQRSASWSGP